MKIGDRFAFARDKRYGINNTSRYNDVVIGTLAKIEPGEPHYGESVENLTFTSPEGEITGRKRLYGSSSYDKGWNPIFLGEDLPENDELAANFARAIDAVHKGLLFHVGANLENGTIGTALLVERDFGYPTAISETCLLIQGIKAKPGDLVIVNLRGINENEYGFITHQAGNYEVFAHDFQLQAALTERWHTIKLMTLHDLDDKLYCHQLAKEEDEVLFYTDGKDVTIITQQGLRAHQSGDLSADAWYWGNGEEPGFYAARDLSWSGSGEDVELEADVVALKDEEVASIMTKCGVDSNELVHNEIPVENIMRIAAILGETEQAQQELDKLETNRLGQEEPPVL